MKLLLDTKPKRKKVFLISDKDNLVEVKQPNIIEAATLYFVLLQRIKKSRYYF